MKTLRGTIEAEMVRSLSPSSSHVEYPPSSSHNEYPNDANQQPGVLVSGTREGNPNACQPDRAGLSPIPRNRDYGDDGIKSQCSISTDEQIAV